MPLSMSDPVLTFLILPAFVLALAAARHFKTLETGFMRAATTPLLCGAVCGIPLAALALPEAAEPAVVGILITFATAYVRHVGDESEPAEGMLLGAVAGASAAIPSAILGMAPMLLFSECVLAGAVAGCGTTLASFHVADRGKRIAIDVATAIAAVAAAAVPVLLTHAGIPARDTAIAVAVAVPLVPVIAAFAQWGVVRHEIEGEAALGFIDESDVRRTAHPILRFGRAGWNNPGAHRQFVRIASMIALRKRQQRNRPGETARLYQLEIIKLRMQLREMTRLGRKPMAEDGLASGDGLPSDRMRD